MSVKFEVGQLVTIILYNDPSGTYRVRFRNPLGFLAGVPMRINSIVPENGNCFCVVLEHEEIEYKGVTFPKNSLSDTKLFIPVEMIEPLENRKFRPSPKWVNWIAGFTPSQISTEISNWTKKRKALGISQKDISKVMQVKQSNVSMIESNNAVSRNYACRYIYAINLIKEAKLKNETVSSK